MRAGVRPGLQILWICLWWIGRFDSDTLPPSARSGDASRERDFRRRAPLNNMSPSKPGKPKPLNAAKEVKRRARRQIGQPPATQPHKTPTEKPPKHKKRAWEGMFE